MNQILYTGNGKSAGPASLKSILKAFSIFLIVFGVIFIGDGSYALYQNRMALKSNIDNSIPNIEFEQEDNNAIVTISHNKGISKVRYRWNDDVDTIVNCNSEDEFILDNIGLPRGINTLYVTAIDINNKVASSSYDFTYDGISIEFPTFDGTYLKILASDVIGLTSMTYSWNNDEEISAFPNSEDNTIIEQSTAVPKGKNTLHVTVVNKENKTQTINKEIEGVTPPSIQPYIQGDKLYVTVTDELGLSKISFQINVDEPEVIELNGEKEYSREFDISSKENILLTIEATNVKGFSKTYKGKKY